MKSLHCVFYVLIINITVAQENLVPNRSFEVSSICPQGGGEIYYAQPWFQPNTYYGNTSNTSSSDLFDICAMSSLLLVPNNIGGYQQPKLGTGYAGIGVFLKKAGIDNYREYIETSLLKPLISGKKYCISFYLSLADTSEYAVCNLGIFFSIDSLLYSSLTYSNINVIPQIKGNEEVLLDDKKNWTLITGEYFAEGGEMFLTIGNFDNDSNTCYEKVDGITGVAYYYIDDVSVVLCEDTLNPTDTFYLHIPNIFTPNADGQNDAWQVRARGVQQLSATVYNRWGALLWQQSVENTAQTEIKTVWSGYTSTGLPVSAGTYYYLVSYTTKEGEIKKEKGFLTLVR